MGTFSPVADVVGARARSFAGVAGYRRAQWGPSTSTSLAGRSFRCWAHRSCWHSSRGWAGWLLWTGKRSGALLEFGLLPVEAAFWYGFALPIPPLLAIAPVVLTIVAWPDLK
jgi:hypothetical protein